MPTQNLATSSKSEERQVSFTSLLPLIVPQLDKDKSLQLQSIYIQLLRNEVSEENFLRLMKGIVDDQIIKKALYKLEAPNNGGTPGQECFRLKWVGEFAPFRAIQRFKAEAQAVPHNIPFSAPEIKLESSDPMADINGKNSLDLCQEKKFRLQNLVIQSERVQNPSVQFQGVPNHQVDGLQYQMRTQNPANLQRTSTQVTQQTMSTQNLANTSKNSKQVTVGQLIAVIVPQLDKNKSMQLQSLYIKSRRNKIPRERFVWLMKEIVGDQMIKMALYKLQTQAKSSQLPQSSLRLHQKLMTSQQTVSIQNSANTSANLKQVVEAQIPSPAPEIKVESSDPMANTNGQISQDKSHGINYRIQNLSIQSQRLLNHQVAESQYLMTTQDPRKLLQISKQQPISTQNPANTLKNPKQVSFGKLIPVIVPQLDKDKSMQLQSLYIKLRRNEVPKEGFLGLMKEIIGDQMIKMALYKLQTQADVSRHIPPSALEVKVESSDPMADINKQISQADLSQGINYRSQNLPIQSQRVQNPQIQSQRGPNHHVTECQYPMANQNPEDLQQTSNKLAHTSKKGKHVSFGKLIPVIVPQLNKDKSMQLQTLYIKLRRNEVAKEGFFRLMKEIVGDEMIEMALYKLQTQAKAEDGSSKLPQLSSHFPRKLITSQQTRETKFQRKDFSGS